MNTLECEVDFCRVLGALRPPDVLDLWLYTEVEVTAPEPHRGNAITQGIPHVLLSAWV